MTTEGDKTKTKTVREGCEEEPVNQGRTPQGSPVYIEIKIPPNTKFILITETAGHPISIRTGGFINIDEMLGFNRRVVNPVAVEQMIIAGIQQQMQAQKKEKDK